MGRAGDRPGGAGASPPRRSKHQRRLLDILEAVEPTREQLIAAMASVGPTVELNAVQAAATSADPNERNKVAAIERNVENLINWMRDLAARALDEGQEQDVVPRTKTTRDSWQRLADLGVIAPRSAERWRQVWAVRNTFGHQYAPSVTVRGTFDAATIVLAELDDYVTRLQDWETNNGILPPARRT